MVAFAAVVVVVVFCQRGAALTSFVVFRRRPSSVLSSCVPRVVAVAVACWHIAFDYSLLNVQRFANCATTSSTTPAAPEAEVLPLPFCWHSGALHCDAMWCGSFRLWHFGCRLSFIPLAIVVAFVVVGAPFVIVVAYNIPLAFRL